MRESEEWGKGWGLDRVAWTVVSGRRLAVPRHHRGETAFRSSRRYRPGVKRDGLASWSPRKAVDRDRTIGGKKVLAKGEELRMMQSQAHRLGIGHMAYLRKRGIGIHEHSDRHIFKPRPSWIDTSKIRYYVCP